MKRVFGIVIGAVLLLAPFTAGAFPNKSGEECIKCHKLAMKDAEDIVRKVVPNGNIKEIKMSPIKGLWQIDVETTDGRHGALYLDFSKKYLVAGQLVPVEQIGKPAPQRKVDVSKIPLHDALVMGPKNAKKKVVVFSDPECPYCRELHKVIKQILAKRSDIAFYIILNPLPMHQGAYKKAQAIICAKSTEMLDDAFSGKPIPEPTCPPDQVEKDKALAKSLDFNGTPTLVRDDGTVLSGYLPEDKLLEWIDKK